jgi:pyruvate dehydrogenase E2 component (dihydrolipoamide acetyltransferase)
MGETMESGRVVAWTKRPGESFTRGETIVEIETDKTTVEVPALADGRLTEIIAGEGADVDVGAPLCRFETKASAAVDAIADSAAETPYETGAVPGSRVPAAPPVKSAPEAPTASDDMLHVLSLPRMGETMESGRVGSWMKKLGDRFIRGETLVEIESDKTTVELPALEDGELVEILAPEGSEIEVGAPLCRFRGKRLASGPASAAPSSVALTAVSEPIEDRKAPPLTATGARPRATPRARKLARDNGIVLSNLAGTGRRGRIEVADVTDQVGGAGSTMRGAAQRFAELPSGRLALREWRAVGAQRGTALLLHGFAGDAQTWAALASLLAATGYLVLAPDLPSHGATVIEAADPAALAEPLAELVEAERLQDLDLVGHSMGALVAVRLAGRIAPRVRRLTLLAPAGMGPEIDGAFVTGMAHATSAGALAHLLRRIAVRPPVLSDTQLAAMVAGLGRGERLLALAASLARANIQQQDLVRPLADLSVPTRIIWGLEDRIVPWTHVQTAPSQVAIHLLADAGHMPHWDKPKETASLFT